MSLSATPLRILLVDDNEDDALLIREAFRKANRPNELWVVHDGIAALAFLNQSNEHADKPRPDVVLLDINMPKLNGFGVLEAMRGNPQLADLPVVMCSTSDHKHEIERALELGARDYLQKPIGFDRLRDMAASFLERWGNPVEPRPAAD